MNIIQIFTEYYQYFLRGTRTTILISLITVFCRAILGCLVALMRISNCKPLQAFSKLYITVIRGTPMLVQLYIVYYQLSFIQYPSGTIWGVDMERAIPCVIALSLNSAAYIAEIIRAAIQSIDKGQLEASTALGLTHSQAMRLVIIPQAYRRMIPPICNEFVMVLKDTSLVSIIALTDLTYQTKIIASNKASALVYIPAMIIYLIITGVFTVIFNRLEKRLSIYE